MNFVIRGLILFAGLYVSTAGGAWMTGNELLNRINGSDRDQFEAFYFIQGVTDFAEGRNITIGKLLDGVQCINIPEGVTAGQLFLTVKKHLEGNPESLHMPAGILVWVAVRDAFEPGDRCF